MCSLCNYSFSKDRVCGGGGGVCFLFFIFLAILKFPRLPLKQGNAGLTVQYTVCEADRGLWGESWGEHSHLIYRHKGLSSISCRAFLGKVCRTDLFPISVCSNCDMLIKSS